MINKLYFDKNRKVIITIISTLGNVLISSDGLVYNQYELESIYKLKNIIVLNKYLLGLQIK